MMKDVLIGVLSMGGVQYYQYIHGLMLNQDGTLSNALPHCHFTFKASKRHDPDTPTLPQDMTVTHTEEFKKVTNKEIDAIEEVRTWSVMVRKHIPKRVNTLPPTWYSNIRRYPDGRFFNFKEIFGIRGYLQQQGVHYTETYYLVVGWYTVRALLWLPMK